MKVVKKIGKITSIVICSLLGLVILFVAGFCVYPSIAFHKFYSNSEKEFVIPGLKEGFIPQGIDYLEDEKSYILSGYNSSSDKASLIYLVSEDGKTSKKIQLKKEDDNLYKKHCGGITRYKDYIYVAGSKKLDVFSLNDIKNCAPGDYVHKIGEVNVDTNASYCYVNEGKIYVGEFYKAGPYEVDKDHYITTNAGDKNYALTVGYNLDDSKDFGVDTTPVEAYSHIGLAQGMCQTNKYMVISTSWGLSASKFYFYDISKIKVEGNITINGTQVPYKTLDSASLDKVVTAPAMAEEIIYHDGKVIFTNESSSAKYIFGNLIGGKWARGYYID